MSATFESRISQLEEITRGFLMTEDYGYVLWHDARRFLYYTISDSDGSGCDTTTTRAEIESAFATLDFVNIVEVGEETYPAAAGDATELTEGALEGGWQRLHNYATELEWQEDVDPTDKEATEQQWLQGLGGNRVDHAYGQAWVRPGKEKFFRIAVEK